MRHRAAPRWTAALVASAALLTGAVRVSAQPSVTFDRFSDQVAANHPIARQARLIAAQGQSTVTEAWGAFEPRLSLSSTQKAYKGQQYFSYLDAALKIPTPIGSDLKLGFERALGSRIDADRFTPSSGLLTLGLSVPLGQRLITDERRTALAQARAARTIAEADQQSLINKLLLDAAKTFGNWYLASRRLDIANEGVQLASFRRVAVVERLTNGDVPAIDTVEASLEVLRRSVARAEAENDLRNVTLVTASYLWDNAGRPVEIAFEQRPVLDGLIDGVIDTARIVSWIDAVAERHPEIRKAQGKLRAVEAERLLAWQGMLPYAEANIASLAGRDERSTLTDSKQWPNTYKFGFEAETPFLFLKERGKAARSQQKVDIARIDRDAIARELAYELRIALNDLVLLERLLVLQRGNIIGATMLRDAEQARYANGESTLLLVNLRERALLDESAKLAALEGKVASARAALVVAVGDPALVARAPR